MNQENGQKSVNSTSNNMLAGSSWQGVVSTRDGLTAWIPTGGCGGFYSAKWQKCTLFRLLEGV